MDCPGPGVLDSLSVYAYNFGPQVTAMEYRIEYPPSMSMLSDISFADPATLVMGMSPIGISLAWPTPKDGTGPLLLHKVLIEWQCEDCDSLTDDPVRPVANAFTGFLGGTDGDFEMVPAMGMISVVCQGAVSTERATWGRIKQNYRE
jgi:hypothetical protein